MALSAKVKKSINNGLQFVIAFLALWFIYRQLSNTENLISFRESVVERSKDPAFIRILIASFLLMPLNWGIEAAKWRILIGYAERVTFIQSFKSVMTGITMSLFTPNRVGEFFGRLLTLKQAPPLKGAFLTITGSISQLLTTLLMGLFAGCLFIPRYLDISGNFEMLLYVLVVILALSSGVIMVLMFLRVSALSRLGTAMIKPSWEKIRGYLRVMRRLSRKVLLKVLSLSMLRYMVFSTQFYLLLHAFGLMIPWFPAFILISMTYFAMTAIPTIALADLGIRGSVAVYFIGMYFAGEAGTGVAILAASTSVWIINLAIPSVIGLFFIKRLKLMRP